MQIPKNADVGTQSDIIHRSFGLLAGGLKVIALTTAVSYAVFFAIVTLQNSRNIIKVEIETLKGIN